MGQYRFMLEKFKPHYLKLGPTKFVSATILVLLITDLLNGYYLKLYWSKKEISRLMVEQSILRSGVTLEDFSPDTFNEMLGFVNNTFTFFLLIILLNNLFFYGFYLKKKLWAQGFVLFYTLTAALFNLTFIFDHAGLGAHWIIYNVLTIPLYLYLYVGIKLLKDETTLPPSPGRGKKGR